MSYSFSRGVSWEAFDFLGMRAFSKAKIASSFTEVDNSLQEVALSERYIGLAKIGFPILEHPPGGIGRD